MGKSAPFAICWQVCTSPPSLSGFPQIGPIQSKDSFSLGIQSAQCAAQPRELGLPEGAFPAWNSNHCKWEFTEPLARLNMKLVVETGKKNRSSLKKSCTEPFFGQSTKHMAMGQNPVPPVNIPIPTKIVPLVLTHSHILFLMVNRAIHRIQPSTCHAMSTSAAPQGHWLQAHTRRSLGWKAGPSQKNGICGAFHLVLSICFPNCSSNNTPMSRPETPRQGILGSNGMLTGCWNSIFWLSQEVHWALFHPPSFRCTCFPLHPQGPR